MEPASIHITHGIESETSDGSASESTAGATCEACPPIFMAGDNAVVTTGSPVKVASADDYYPYGMIMEGRSFNYGQADTRYKFLTKERDTETGFDWLEARAYDARIGRFFVIDPLAEKATLRGWSPYHYSFDNPMRFADPSGMEPGDDGAFVKAIKGLVSDIASVADLLAGEPQQSEETDRAEEEATELGASKDSKDLAMAAEVSKDVPLRTTELGADAASTSGTVLNASAGVALAIPGGQQAAGALALAGTVADAAAVSLMAANMQLGGDKYSTPQIVGKSMFLAAGPLHGQLFRLVDGAKTGLIAEIGVANFGSFVEWFNKKKE